MCFRFLSIPLCLLILFSQLGVSITIHYCGNKAIRSGITLGTSTLSCGMEEFTNKCSDNSNSICKKPCCGNRIVSLSLAETVCDSFIEVLQVLNFIPTFRADFYRFEILKKSLCWVVSGDPPDRSHHLQALYQVFII